MYPCIAYDPRVIPHAHAAVEAGSLDHDRAAVMSVEGNLVLVVADGVGGLGGGLEAAEGALRLVRDKATQLAAGSLEPATLLETIDRVLSDDRNAGEASVVLAVVRDGEITGASVGDSGAWLVSKAGVRDLSGGQARKPMIGSGEARPVAFGPAALAGRLLLASDGLLKYTSEKTIQTAALAQELETSAWSLIETVRLPSGDLHDDVSVILCERSETP